MLLSSKLTSYAHSIKNVHANGRRISAKSQALSLSINTSVNTLNTLHMLNIADGLEPVGRRIIAQSSEKAADPIQSAVLGYVYKSRFCESLNNKELVTTKHADRLLIEPKLAIRLGNTPDKSCSFEEFFLSFNAIAMGLDVTLVPFKEDWHYEDKICANGFDSQLILGVSKTLSRESKRNLTSIINQSTFSISKISASQSTIMSYSLGHQAAVTTIADLYEVFRKHCEEFETTPLAKGDWVALNALTKPISIENDDELVFVANGLDLDAVRVKFTK